METPCGHKYHKECLTKWMDNNLVCPNCRASIPPN